MKKKPLFESSNDIIELASVYENQARQLAEKLKKDNGNFFVEIHCAPNEQLNAFHYGNGLQSAEILLGLVGSFLGNDIFDFEQKIKMAKSSNFETDFNLGERLGLWTRIKPNDYPREINWSAPFCVKNKKGLTRIWDPKKNKSGYAQGLSTREAIKNTINGDPSYLQPFYQPLESLNRGNNWKMVYHLIFFCAPDKTEFVGGLWISRPNFKVYLNKDSLVGLISPQKA